MTGYPLRSWRRAASLVLVSAGLFVMQLTTASPAVGAGSVQTAVADAPSARTTAAQKELHLLARPARLMVEAVPLVEALNALQANAGVAVAFSSWVIPSDRIVSCLCEQATVGDAIRQLLTNTGLEFAVAAGQVVISAQGGPTEPVVRSSPSFATTAPPILDLRSQGTIIPSLASPTLGRSPSEPENRRLEGTIRGQATHAETGEGVAAVQVSVQGTGLGVLTGADGAFSITGVQAGTYTVLAQRLGFQSARVDNVVVVDGAEATVEILMRPVVLALQEIVATGLVDPVEGVRSPISVGRVSREYMPVMPAGSAVQALQGKMAGVQITRRDGRPGGDVEVMLRTPTSILGSGAPLFVVDGVILGAGTVDVESMDIESIEVIRGAAAASLYGSRAAAGVIAIRTARGSNLALGQTRFTARTEIGVSQALSGQDLPTHHCFLVDDKQNPTTYVDANGNPVGRAERIAPPANECFMDTPYPDPIYDNLENIYQGGGFTTQNVAMMQNGENTNFALSVNRFSEAGPLTNNDGYRRTSYRVNLDHRFLDDLQLGLSTYHSRDSRDEFTASFQNMLLAPPDVDLRQKDEDGNYLRVPNPDVPYENPLWTQASRESDRTRVRTLASANLRWDPFYWLSVGGNVSYDRQDSMVRTYVPKGTPLSVTADVPSDGSISFNGSEIDTWNGDAEISLRRAWGPLNIRTTFRGILERNREQAAFASGSNFFIEGVPRINATADRSSSSSEQEERAAGYLWDTSADYAGRYILSVLGRRDGSSLFGPDNRWHNYYRVAAAWRIAEESWFDMANVDELKVRYARGTAGGKPNFSAQYETWNASATGVSKGTLGNRNLRPEHTTEDEFGIEAILYGRIGLEFVYARQRTEDQLVDISLPAVVGYSSQWSNIGTVEGNTIEITAEAQLMTRPTFDWSTLVVFDRSRSEIVEWGTTCRAPPYRSLCTGVGMWEIHASPLVMRLEGGSGTRPDLATHHGGNAAPFADEFVINDEGYVVWVGAGNNYTDGLWGESTTIAGQIYNWGMPFFWTNEEGSIPRGQIGNGENMNLGWLNNVRIGQFSLHGHLHAVIGGEIADHGFRALTLQDRHPEMDQAGKPEELRKPVAYYIAREGGRANQSIVYSASFLKLRTLSVNYTFSTTQINSLGLSRIGVSSATLGLIGRDLFSVHNCVCADPEQARNLSDRSSWLQTGASTGGYPSSRSFTASIEVGF